MKTILLIISIMIFGLYSCEDEVINPTPTTEQETKKYTLEEILADSNWVEITDTLHYDKIEQLSYESIGWKNETMKIISNNEDYVKLKLKNDTSYAGYKPIELKVIDFSKYDLIGYYLQNNWVEISKHFFVNNKIKEYCYILKIRKFNVNYILLYYQNWLLVPKINSEYKMNIVTDYIWAVD